jgi:hypothetical protein
VRHPGNPPTGPHERVPPGTGDNAARDADVVYVVLHRTCQNNIRALGLHVLNLTVG